MYEKIGYFIAQALKFNIPIGVKFPIGYIKILLG